MRALLQRVSEAAVRIDGVQTARVGPGLLILLGVAAGDTEADARWTAAKCADLRIFDDEAGLLNDSLLDTGGEALVVSQFTLYGDPRRGRRPSWSHAAAGPEAEALYTSFCDALREAGVPVSTGEFGAKMEVHLVNDGPVTLLVESPS